MSRALQKMAQPVPYTLTSDAVNRHGYGVTKGKKTTSTGGGRAWTEEEELFLIQMRLQKMPYKHIAAHLKKTELACRLHYHQLSHGSNRRKRATSTSSASSTSGHSPTLRATIPSPIQEHRGGANRSASPPESTRSFGSASPGGIQLPSIMSATASANTSPRLPSILPKPVSMTLALASIGAPGSAGSASPTASGGFRAPLHEARAHSPAPVVSTGFRGAGPAATAAGPQSSHPSGGSQQHHGPGPLRLDCSALPPPVPTGMAGPSFGPSHPVDMARLTAAYNAHRASFWAAVAADYGPGANPLVLEQAWRSSGAGQNAGVAAHTPITPVGSPDDHMYGGVVGATQGKPADKTRISAILGIDANPRSPSEREMVRRMEEERCSVGMVGA